MNIQVLNGSPGGQLSVTLQYVAYLQKKFSNHTFKVAHVAKRIMQLERDGAAFDALMAEVRTADLVLWATPVYYMLVPGQLKRFIELVAERGATGAFAGRAAAALTTSIHFYDHTAHNYMAGICEDWGMRFYGGHSAEYRDLLSTPGREQFRRFAENLMSAASEAAVAPSSYAAVIPHGFTYAPGPSHRSSRTDWTGRPT